MIYFFTMGIETPQPRPERTPQPKINMKPPAPELKFERLEREIQSLAAIASEISEASGVIEYRAEQGEAARGKSPEALVHMYLDDIFNIKSNPDVINAKEPELKRVFDALIKKGVLTNEKVNAYITGYDLDKLHEGISHY